MEPAEDTTGMTCIGQEITEELDFTEAKLQINRYMRNKYITKEDEKANQKQVIAPLNRPIHKCIASLALLAMIFANKYLYHLPVYRTRLILAQMGVTIVDSTLESWIKLGADLIRTLYAIHRLYVFKKIYQNRELQPPPGLDRKNSLFAGSHDAAVNIAMVCSFFGNCLKHNINPQKWLKYAMDSINTTPASNFKDLLPQFIDKSLR